MIDRLVTQSGKDADGDITKLCNPGKYWSPVSKTEAISHIEQGLYRYYTEDSQGRAADVQVYKRDGVKHLRTDSDSSSANNLDNLPDC